MASQRSSFLLIWYQFWSLQKLLRNVEEVMTAAFQLAALPKTALFEVCIGGRPCHLCHRIWPFGAYCSASIVPSLRAFVILSPGYRLDYQAVHAQTVGDFSIYTYRLDGQVCIDNGFTGLYLSIEWWTEQTQRIPVQIISCQKFQFPSLGKKSLVLF